MQVVHFANGFQLGRFVVLGIYINYLHDVVPVCTCDNYYTCIMQVLARLGVTYNMIYASMSTVRHILTAHS